LQAYKQVRQNHKTEQTKKKELKITERMSTRTKIFTGCDKILI